VDWLPFGCTITLYIGYLLAALLHCRLVTFWLHYYIVDWLPFGCTFTL